MAENRTERLLLPMSWNETVAFIVIIIVFIIIGVIGNIIVIVVYFRIKKRLAANVLTIALAATDLTATLTSMPLGPPHGYGVLPNGLVVLFICVNAATIIISLTILLALSIDRYYAVHEPFAYNEARRNRTLVRVTAGVSTCLIVFLETFIFLKMRGIQVYLLSVYMVITILAITVMYILIFKKLYAQRTNVIHVAPVPGRSSNQPTTQGRSTSGSSKTTHLQLPKDSDHVIRTPGTTDAAVGSNAIPSCSSSAKRNDRIQGSVTQHGVGGIQSYNNSIAERKRKHVRMTANMFCVISALFIISYAPWAISFRVTKVNSIIVYSHYINNICNPFVYWLMNERFRSQVKELLHAHCIRIR